MSKTVKRLIIGSLLLVVLVGLAWPKLTISEVDDGARGAAGAAAPLAVQAYVVTPTVLADRVLTTGTLRANEAVTLSSESAGRITEILFDEGRRVQQGALLLKINDAELQAQRVRIEYRLRLAEEQVARQQALLAKGGVSQEAFDRTQNELNVLRAELQLNAAQIAKTEVRAPFDGILGLRHVSAGSYLTPQSPIATLQDVTPIKLDFSIPEKYAGLVGVGAEVRFRVSGQGRTFRGTVFAVEPRIDEETRTLQMRATSPNEDLALLPGAFADVELVVNEIPDALAVPAIAVVPDLQGTKVYVVENGRVQPRPVETGLRTDSAVQIVSGLAPQDTVLTSGLLQVRPGVPVQVTVE